MSHRFRLFSFCAISTYARAVAQRSRAELLLNGSWDTVLDAEGGKIPPEGWAPRRVPAAGGRQAGHLGVVPASHARPRRMGEARKPVFAARAEDGSLRVMLTEIDRVRAPILIINGRNDDNSPPSIIDVYVKKLRAAGKQVETYLTDNGPHGF